MKFSNALLSKPKVITAMPGKILMEDSEKRVLPKGTIVEHKGRKWELTGAVEVVEK